MTQKKEKKRVGRLHCFKSWFWYDITHFTLSLIINFSCTLHLSQVIYVVVHPSWIWHCNCMLLALIKHDVITPRWVDIPSWMECCSACHILSSASRKLEHIPNNPTRVSIQYSCYVFVLLSNVSVIIIVII